jgi:hypothetical protein
MAMMEWRHSSGVSGRFHRGLGARGPKGENPVANFKKLHGLAVVPANLAKAAGRLQIRIGSRLKNPPGEGPGPVESVIP